MSAIYNGRFVRTMRTTVRNDPSLIRQKDTEGRLPLHHAARHSAPLPVVRFLVRRFEAALLEKNGDVYLPLHFAAQHTSLKMSPASLRRRRMGERTPPQ